MRTLELVMINGFAIFEVSIFTRYGNTKGNAYKLLYVPDCK